jgi:hypothetical protein
MRAWNVTWPAASMSVGSTHSSDQSCRIASRCARSSAVRSACALSAFCNAVARLARYEAGSGIGAVSEAGCGVSGTLGMKEPSSGA